MLQLINIQKDYKDGEQTVKALKGIDLQFRKSEFVSILGPSGCGKTTMLNIIGGLDRYSRGDLVIGGRSTKEFKDRDWDTYRNHSIGFVFQSYHLIPHQTVLQNVELALTLSGVPKAQRRKRAKEALEKVGLADQLRKKPGQMSGGQMQRVAIARALVNDPEIILADEPTGALDTQTSVQVMDLLKEIAKDRLVIMVTHNPELAENYSTRIIRMLDGTVLSDSMPLTEEEIAAMQAPAKKEKRTKKPSMSLWTSFGLSLKNLITKKGRTALTGFAGSIGIIGIALIFAISNGTTTYINAVQEDTLASYPLSIQATSVDISTLLSTFADVGKGEADHPLDAVYGRSVLGEMINAMTNMEAKENDLKSFGAYIREQMAKEDSDLSNALSGVQYTYNIDLPVYTKSEDGTVILSDTQELLSELMLQNLNVDMTAMTEARSSMMTSFTGSAMSSSQNLWCEMLSGKDGSTVSPLLQKQYDVVSGVWPTAYNEIVLVLDKNNELEDITLYALGLETRAEIDEIFADTSVEQAQKKWSYEELMGRTFRVVPASSCYVADENTGIYTDLRDTQTGLRYLYDQGVDLKIVGIVRPNEDASSAMLTGSIAYTYKLTEYLLNEAAASEAVQAQKENPNVDIFTGLQMKPDTEDTSTAALAQAFRDYIGGLDSAGKAAAYVRMESIPSAEQLQSATEKALQGQTRDTMAATLKNVFAQEMSLSEEKLNEYFDGMTEEEITELYTQLVEKQVEMQMAAQVQAKLSMYGEGQLVVMLEKAMATLTDEQCAAYYDKVPEFSENTYADNLEKLGCVDAQDPASINLYASSFENKDVIEQAIADYNETVPELQKIQYTDYVGILMSSVTTIIDAITYVLIAFVATSLVVSSIMIGVITLISVQERTKEIGILRAIGASKRNVSSLFNAETVMIGLLSGLLGVGTTYLICWPLNIIVKKLTDIPNLKAILPWQIAAALVLISVILTLIAGIIPAKSAAKKDPVVALRTE